MKTNPAQTGIAPEAVADDMQQIFKKRSKVESVKQCVSSVISELAGGNKCVNLSIHKSEREMLYVMINKGVVITMHIQEVGNAIQEIGREAV